ncbi:MAG: ABC transporter permease [Microthrixaceae bacterium]
MNGAVRGRPQTVRALAAVVLRTLFSDPAALFFMIVLPVMVTVVVGSAFGGQQRLGVGVVESGDSDLGDAIVAALRRDDNLRVETLASRRELSIRLGRQQIAAGVVIPDRLGDPGVDSVSVIASPTSQFGFAARSAVGRVVAEVAGEDAVVRVVARRTGEPVDGLRDRAGGHTAAVDVVIDDVGDSPKVGHSRFSDSASANLVLFVFINCLTSGALLVRLRQRGVLRRAASAPVSSWGITVGLAAGWIGLAVLQSALVIGITWAAFGVTWGDPMAASALVVVYGLVGCGAGLLVGVIGNDVDRVAAVTPVIGLITAALGGCMMPIEIFPPTMVTIAHAAPQYWALRAWHAVIYDGVGLGGVAVELAVLSGFAVVLLAGAALGLRRRL